MMSETVSKRSKNVRVGIAGLVTALSCVVSATVVSSLAFGSERHLPTGEPTDGYSTNDNGLTYGSDFGESVSPDLILATGDDGETGYVKREDVYGPDDVTIEDVKRQMEQGAAQDRTIPLYAEDGTTVIGTFTLVAATDVEATEK